MTSTPRLIAPLCLALLPGVGASLAMAQGADPSGIQFVTVGAPGNPAYAGPDPGHNVGGRGSVGYEYRIGLTEVTTGQWMEFMNAARARPDPIPYISFPAF